MSFTPVDEQFMRRKPVKSGFDDRTTRLMNQPSAYDYVYNDDAPAPLGSRMHPRHWSRRCWLISAIVFVIIVIIAVVVGVEVSKAMAYPNYSKLTYSLDTVYGGTSFFDGFDYFTGYDPSAGFVQ